MIDFKELFYKRKICKNRKWVYIPIFFIFSYLLFVINAKDIETNISFPGIFVNTMDLFGETKTKLGIEDITLISKDNNIINGLYLDNKAKKTVYYFHGNGGDLSYFYDEIKYIGDLGYNVISYDYPGYGKSTGIPYSENLSNSSIDFYNYVKDKKSLSDENLIIWGYSIGTAVSIDFAKRINFDKLVLISPFSSRYDMSIYNFGFAIQKLLFLPSTFDSLESMKFIKKPILIIHGNSDKIIPFGQGKKLFSNYLGNKKYFIELDNFGHNFIIKTFGESLKSTFKQFIETGKLDDRYIFLDDYEKEQLKSKKYIPEIIEKINKEIISSGIVDSNTGKIIQEKILKMGFDLSTDDSITKFVNNKISFFDKEYKPLNLVKISSDFVTYLKGDTFLRTESNAALQEMAKDFYQEFGEKILVISAYRSYGYQVGIKKGGCSDSLCAKAGYSEHQSGLAIDLWSASSKNEFLSDKKLSQYFDWMKNNAHKYGFTNSYQKGLLIDGYVEEPWHWRFVGKKLSEILWQKGETFAEFYNN